MIKEMTVEQVREKLNNNSKLSLIDVRETEEFEAGTISGAIHIPLGEIPYRYKKINKDQPHIIICRSGGRSGKATEFLQNQGYDVTNMLGGMLAWEGESV